MKKFFIIISLIGLSAAGFAQVSAYKQGISASVEGYSLPRTVIEVKVVQEREVIIRGPYARYAAQYLGVAGAPMSDRETYKILGATLSWTTEPDPSQIYAIDEKSGSMAKVFNWIVPAAKATVAIAADRDFAGAQLAGRMPFTDMGTSTVVENGDNMAIDRASAVEKSPEQMAADAASMIFKLRKRRVELVCGEQGENVFGAGLSAALKKIARLEKEYVSLFLGKRYVQRTEHLFNVVPEAGKNRLVAFRFSPTKGVAGVSDLSASPINMEFSPISALAAPTTKRSAARAVQYRVPQIEAVTITDGTTVLASDNIPVFQRGVMVEAPVL